MLLIGLKHLLHMAADGVANPEEGGSVGKMGCQAVSQKREEVRLIHPLLALEDLRACPNPQTRWGSGLPLKYTPEPLCKFFLIKHGGRVHTCHSTCVEVRELLCGVRSVLSPFCGLKGLNAGHQVSIASTFTQRAILTALVWTLLE